MRPLQEWIHGLETGAPAQLVKVALGLLVFVTLALVYDVRCFKNFSTQEAMDSAQLGRSIAEGKGFATQFIRPISLHYLKRKLGDPHLKTAHPDIANPPVYPLLLAGVLILVPAHYDITDTSRANFSTYSPEVWIAIFNQILFGVALILLFRLARKLFDSSVAWLAALVFGGSELFWRFSVSGLSTLLLMVILLGIASLLVSLQERIEAPERKWLWGIAAAIGLLLGAGALTRYSFLWLAAPIGFYLLRGPSRIRCGLAGVVLATALLVLTPWLARNYHYSGRFFGLAGLSLVEGTAPCPDNLLERSLNPGERLEKVNFFDYGRKVLVEAKEILRTEIPKFSGSWVGAFFLVGLLLAFKSPTLSGIRAFLVGSLLIFFLAETLGRTHLSTDSPEINSENLMVILAPLVILFGVGLYAIFVEQLPIPSPALRPLINGLFLLVMWAPLILAILPPRTYPLAYPPYFPPHIQKDAGYMKEKELLMSDIPWAVAWYGRRQCVWLTTNPREEFYRINDEIKPVQGLYLSASMTDSKLLTEILRDKQSWGYFIYQIYSKSEVPPDFPLKKSPELSDRLFLSDWERWKVTRKP